MENQQLITDRVADLEAELAELRRLVAPQRDQTAARPVPVWWIRTQGEKTGYYDETIYPAQDPAAPVTELPIVYLNCEVADPNTDPVIWTPRSDQPQILVVSPGGWIPENIELKGFRHHDGRLHVLDVPVLRVVAVDTIAAGQSGTVTLWRNGSATAQEFEAWNDWLNGGAAIEAGKQCVARLDDDVRHWSLSAGVEC